MPMTTFRQILICCITLAVSNSIFGADKTSYFAFVGTYINKGEGIYNYKFDARTGKLQSIGLAAKTANPTFLAVHPNHRFLYSVNAEKDGGVSAFSIDRATGHLTFLNRVSSKGDGPTYIVIDRTGKWVLVANYNSGSIAALPIHADGTLGEASSFIQHHGSSVNPQRQQGPHAHFITISADNRFAIVCDLGLDEVLVYRFDATHGTLTPNDPPYAKVDPGAGPRHFAFHPNGKFGYVVAEMASTVTAFAWDGTHGVLRKIQTITTVPKGFSGNNTGAEIAVNPNGRFLYASNRGDNSIAVFTIDSTQGTLTPLEYVSTQGKTPRFFTLDPTDHFLFAANQDTGNIVLFKLDPKTGHLTPADVSVSLPAPVCVVFVPAS